MNILVTVRQNLNVWFNQDEKKRGKNMKNCRRLLLLLLSLCLAFALASCGATSCDKCIDENGDGICDNCDNPIETAASAEDVVLIEDDVPTFKIVWAKDTPNAVKQLVNTSIKATLKNEYGSEIVVVTDGSADDKASDVEILVGRISSRGEEYDFDGHDLGKEGYAMRIVNSKIILSEGSADCPDTRSSRPADCAVPYGACRTSGSREDDREGC